MISKEVIPFVLGVIAFIVLVSIFAYKCESERKESIVKNKRVVPVKPFYIIDKVSYKGDFTIYCIDLNGNEFDFDVEFFNEDKYRIGDTIK